MVYLVIPLTMLLLALILFTLPGQSASEVGLLSEAAKNVGLATALVTVVVGGFREWYVFGPSHRRALAGKDAEIAVRDAEISRLNGEVVRWQNMHITALSAASKGADTIHHLVGGDAATG